MDGKKLAISEPAVVFNSGNSAAYSLMDEVRWTFDSFKPKLQAKIRITFNRPLTYSERNTLWEWVNEAFDGVIKTRFSSGDKLLVEDYADDDSRGLYQLFADYVAKNFVNVHPVAVKTFKPEVKV